MVFGIAMVGAVVMGVAAIRRRDFTSHSAWMTRAYAIGMGAGTQVFTHLPWSILVGEFTEGPRAVMMGAGWAINVIVAEWVIRRQSLRSLKNAMTYPSASLTSNPHSPASM